MGIRVLICAPPKVYQVYGNTKHREELPEVGTVAGNTAIKSLLGSYLFRTLDYYYKGT